MSREAAGYLLRLLLAVVIITWVVVTAGCTDEAGTRRALEGAGYTSIELTGHEWTTCGNDETCTGFEAIGPTGKRVSGAVGCGYTGCSKGCTIRLH